MLQAFCNLYLDAYINVSQLFHNIEFIFYNILLFNDLKKQHSLTIRSTHKVEEIQPFFIYYP